MGENGMQIGEYYYVLCENCKGKQNHCKICNGSGWIATDDTDDWHPYKKDFDDYDKRERHGYFVSIECSHCQHKTSVLYEFNIVDEKYYADVALCARCDNSLPEGIK